MIRFRKGAACLAMLVVLALAVSACGDASGPASAGTTSPAPPGRVAEGEPVTFNGLRISVASRYLNPKDRGDAAYLYREPVPSGGLRYAAVFVEVQNESDEPHGLPVMSVTDAAGTAHDAFPPATLYSRHFDEAIEPHEKQPELASLVRSPPTKRTILLFRLAPASDKPPLTLHIQVAAGDEGKVTLTPRARIDLRNLKQARYSS